MTPRPIILASASPRRRELLTQIGLTFTVLTANIDETPRPNENPVKYTVRLAEAKARAILAQHPEAIVLGADTIVTIDGQLLGKPRNTADAERMLQLLQGRTHQVTTGIAILTSAENFEGDETGVPAETCIAAETSITAETRIAAETTDVTFAPMDTATIRAYIATGEPMDKAGAYAIQGIAAQWIPHIQGDYSNVVGLPLARLAAILCSLPTQPTPS